MSLVFGRYRARSGGWARGRAEHRSKPGQPCTHGINLRVKKRTSLIRQPLADSLYLCSCCVHGFYTPLGFRIVFYTPCFALFSFLLGGVKHRSAILPFRNEQLRKYTRGVTSFYFADRSFHLSISVTYETPARRRRKKKKKKGGPGEPPVQATSGRVRQSLQKNPPAKETLKAKGSANRSITRAIGVQAGLQHRVNPRLGGSNTLRTDT